MPTVSQIAQSTRHGKPPRLLLVEDDEVLRRTLLRLLIRKFAVTETKDAEEAISAMEQSTFDVILSDIGLPTISGVELLRRVRAHDLEVPVVLMTGQPSIETAIEAIELGAFTYLKKPFDTDHLEQTLDRAAKLCMLARMKREALSAVASGPALAGDRLGLSTSFDRALESLWMAFQPIVDARSQGTAGFEALVRSSEPMMPNPLALLEAAERLGRMHDLGRRVRACAAASFAPPTADAMLFVNVHAADLSDPDLYAINAPLTRIASRVVLEVTERVALEEVADIRARATELRGLGYRIAVDDLGAGYAGLTSFANLEPEIVKLDMSLVRGIDKSPVRSRIVEGIASLCRSLDMRVVAEGIETRDELRCVQALGCDYLQGYLFGKPARDIAVGARHD